MISLHRHVQARLEAQVAVGDDADHAAFVDHREAGDAVLLGQFDHVRTGTVGVMVMGIRSRPDS